MSAGQWGLLLKIVLYIISNPESLLRILKNYLEVVMAISLSLPTHLVPHLILDLVFDSVMYLLIRSVSCEILWRKQKSPNYRNEIMYIDSFLFCACTLSCRSPVTSSTLKLLLNYQDWADPTYSMPHCVVWILRLGMCCSWTNMSRRMGFTGKQVNPNWSKWCVHYFFTNTFFFNLTWIPN